jgi:peptide/nickel transport system permease protein
MLTVLTISFVLTRLSGDLAISIAGPQATAEDVAIIRKAYGLDRPQIVQFLDWVRSVASGDLGRSYLYHEPVANLIRERLPVTLTLGLVGLAIAMLTGIPLGILLLIIWLGLKLQWLPIAGVDEWDGYVLPGIVLAFSAVPALMRLTRSGMVDALTSDYIRTARAKGLSRASIVLKHALRNAAMPVVAVAAVQFGFMLSGSIVIEAVFSLHGIGYLGWESISKNDFPVVQAVVLFLAVIFICLTLLADLLNALLDPRLRAA